MVKFKQTTINNICTKFRNINKTYVIDNINSVIHGKFIKINCGNKIRGNKTFMSYNRNDISKLYSRLSSYWRYVIYKLISQNVYQLLLNAIKILIYVSYINSKAVFYIDSKYKLYNNNNLEIKLLIKLG